MINEAALVGFRNAIESMIASSGNPDLEATIAIGPVRITPTGVGGFVRLNEDPIGEVYGRRVEGTVSVAVTANNEESLNGSVASLLSALIGRDKATLRESGIYRIDMDGMGSVVRETGRFEQDATFSVLYEYLRIPEEAESVITQIPRIVRQAPKTLFDLSFESDLLDAFEVIEDPGVNQPGTSDWRYNAGEQRIEQLSNITGGPSGPVPRKNGTFLLLNAATGTPTVSDLDLTVPLSSDDNDGIGLVFRWQNVDNFYYFYMDSQRNFRIMGKKVGGTFAHFDSIALDEANGYIPGTRYSVRVSSWGPVMRAYIDDRLVLEGSDNSLLGPGRVGFMSRLNNRAYFYGINVVV